MSNRSVALQLWAIAALAPLAFILTGPVDQYDFAPLWVAGKQLISGDAKSVYDMAAAQAVSNQFTYGTPAIFPYPPHALLTFAPFALLRYLFAYVVWGVATAALFMWAAKPYLPEGFPWPLAVLTPAALICLDFGQTGLLIGALWLMAFRGKWAAVALLTIKPHLGILSILSLRDRSAFVRASLLAAVILLGSAALLGPTLWLDFVQNSMGHVERVGDWKRWLFAGVSPAIGYGMVGWLGFAVAAGAILSRNVNAFTAATAALLVSPYGFHYDMPVACLGFGLMIYQHWDEMPLSMRFPMTLGFLSPVLAYAGAWFIPPVLLWGLWAQTQLGSRRYEPLTEVSIEQTI